MAGVMMAGALTQWNAAASNAMPWDWGGAAGMVEPGVPWDWGMGWGWAGWTPEGALGGGSAAAFCGSCALEQHHAAMYASEASHSASYNNLPDRYLPTNIFLKILQLHEHNINNIGILIFPSNYK